MTEKTAAQWAEHAAHDCVQDGMENAPFASVGGLDHRSKMKAPNYVPAEHAEAYLEGYRRAALESYGPQWETVGFGWGPAITINEPERPKEPELPTEVWVVLDKGKPHAVRATWMEANEVVTALQRAMLLAPNPGNRVDVLHFVADGKLQELEKECTRVLQLAQRELRQLTEYSGSAGNWPLHEASTAVDELLKKMGAG